MEFRKDINGLRALAVLAVVLYHFNPARLPGGFSGVDVFFVISGYLMTSIICRGLGADGKFSLVRFYIARVRRIVPALSVLCLSLLVFGWFVLLPGEYKRVAWHVVGSLGFFSNIIYFMDVGYFTASSNTNWLLHTWSLSVEWQFYMIYPIILMAVKRLFGLVALRGFIIAGLVLGFGLSLYFSNNYPEQAFYLLYARAWELLAGGVLFFLPVVRNGALSRLAEGLGLLMIGVGYFAISKALVWPGYYALIPVLGTMLVIIANRQDSFFTGNVIAQRIGLYSYSIYLWHWPVMVYMVKAGLLTSMAKALVGIAISVVLGMLSYHLIEKSPARQKTVSRKRRLVWSTGVAGVAVLALLVFGANGVNSNIRGEDFSEKSEFIDKYARLHENLYEEYWLKCDAYDHFSKNKTLGVDESCTRKSGAGGVFLWGDSHAEAISLGIRSSLHDGVPFYQVTSAACAPSLSDDHASAEFRRACNYSNALALESIAELKPALVVMAQQLNHEQTDWTLIADHLKRLGVKDVVLVGPVPQWLPSLPQVVTQRHWKTPDNTMADVSLDARVLKSDALVKAQVDIHKVHYISIVDKLCSGVSCLFKVGGSEDLLVVDYGHLSPSASKYLGREFIGPYLENLLK